MVRRSTKSATEEDTATLILRLRSAKDTAMGCVYAWTARSRTRRKMIEEAIVRSFLPYAYEEQSPELAQEAAQSSIEELQAYIEQIQRDFNLKGTPPHKGVELVSHLPLQEILSEFRLIRQALTYQSTMVDELRLLREGIGTIPVTVTANTLAPSETPSPALNEAKVEAFLTGSTDFLFNLEEIL